LARDHIIICYRNQTKKNNMSIEFFITGGVIFAIYLGLMIWNIIYSGRKQQEENYPNLNKPIVDETKSDSAQEKDIWLLWINLKIYKTRRCINMSS